MKKIILSVALLAVIASCSKNEVTELPKSNQIGFTTLNDRVVAKAANDAGTATDFKVFAAKEDGTAWYINDYVTGGAASATAPVAGPYYWPTDGKDMKFYAYAPYVTSGGNITEDADTYGAIKLDYVVPTNAQEDFTVAKPVEATFGTFPTSVDFTFKHMLSKVTVKVKLEENYGKNNKITKEGTATITTPNNSYADLDATATEPAIDATKSTEATTGDDNYSYEGTSSYYIMPQAMSGCTITLKGIEIKDNATNSVMVPTTQEFKTITLNGTETSSVNFESGKHYVFTVTINSNLNEIKFTATTAGWDTEINGGVETTTK